MYYFSSLLPFFVKLYDKELLRPFPHFLSIICLFLSLSEKKAASRSPATTSHGEMMPMICLLLFLFFVYFPFIFRLPFWNYLNQTKENISFLLSLIFLPRIVVRVCGCIFHLYSSFFHFPVALYLGFYRIFFFFIFFPVSTCPPILIFFLRIPDRSLTHRVKPVFFTLHVLTSMGLFCLHNNEDKETKKQRNKRE